MLNVAGHKSKPIVLTLKTEHMNKKQLILLIAAIVSVCPSIWAQNHTGGFSKTGYVLYLNSTENEMLELVDPSLEEFLSLTSDDVNVVSLGEDGKTLIPEGEGETTITAHSSHSIIADFKIGVKVINPNNDNELYMRVKSNDAIPVSGIIVSKCPELRQDITPYKYVMMYNSNGSDAGVRIDRVYGDGEIIFYPGEWESSAENTFDKQESNNYKIKNANKFLLPAGNAIMKYGDDSNNEAKATISIEDNYLTVHYIEWLNLKRFLYFDNINTKFIYKEKAAGYYPVELYTLRTVTFEAPDVNGVKVCIDGNVNSSENIQLEEGDHQLTFTDIPEEAKLYYKFSTAGAPQQVIAKEGTNGEWTRYVDGQPITVNKSSGQIEFYTESHGLKSNLKVKSFTVPTGSNCIEIDSNDTEATVYFDLSGNRVNPTDLKPGIYIKRVGAKTEKVVI